jgi:N-acetylglucosaminyldiphosphoundecaprenol N-acetyl-beta-D-mannosaminyltransferase
MPRIQVLDLPVDVLDRDALIDAVTALVKAGNGGRVGYLNVHIANLAAGHAPLTAFLESTDICYCDGEGIRWAARMLGSELPERMTGADWIWDLAAQAEVQAWRLFWLGQEPGITQAAADALLLRHPNLEIQTDHGFHDDKDQGALMDRIRAFQPHIILVGLGSPMQEAWVTQWSASLSPAVCWCLGSTANFISGKTPRGPSWLVERQEWLARLVTEPTRLWKRYLIGNSLFALRVARRKLRGV